jgi:hypothetical protein
MTARKIHPKAAIDFYGPFWKLLDASERKLIIHTALYNAGQQWLEKFLAQRFGNYAYRLGYRVTEQWKRYKRRVLKGNAIPYIGVTVPGGSVFPVVRRGNKIFVSKTPRNFEKMAVAVQRSNVKITGTASYGQINIAVPYGHPVQQNLSDAFKKIPDNELGEVGAEVKRQLGAMLKQARPVPKSRGGKITIRDANISWTPRVGGFQGPRTR